LSDPDDLVRKIRGLGGPEPGLEEERRHEEVRTMIDQELQARRKAAGERIDPDTAEVFFIYAQVLDPYGDDLNLPEECYCVGREWFAADPIERLPVAFRDLPHSTEKRLEEKRRTADREGWRVIFEIMRESDRMRAEDGPARS
jgi:hypothetical protein